MAAAAVVEGAGSAGGDTERRRELGKSCTGAPDIAPLLEEGDGLADGLHWCDLPSEVDLLAPCRATARARLMARSISKPPSSIYPLRASQRR